MDTLVQPTDVNGCGIVTKNPKLPGYVTDMAINPWPSVALVTYNTLFTLSYAKYLAEILSPLNYAESVFVAKLYARILVVAAVVT